MERPANTSPAGCLSPTTLRCCCASPAGRTIAEHVGITERAAQRIVAELIAEGYLTRTKKGRRNRYEIKPPRAPSPPRLQQP